MQILRPIFLLLLIAQFWGDSGMVRAQSRYIVHVEGYIHGIDHKGFIFNSNLTCDSLNIRDIYGKKPPADELLCYTDTYTSDIDFSIYQRDGVSLCIDSVGNFYSKDMYGSFPPYYLNINLDQLIHGKKNMVLEVDDYGYDSLVVRSFPLKNYVVGKKDQKGMERTAIYYNSFTYPARQEISPDVMYELETGTFITPEDGKIEDEFTVHLPIDKVPFSGTWTMYIYDLSGNILKMITPLDKKENVLSKENLTPGTYRYAIYFNRDKIIKKGMIFFKPAKKPE